jgi:hypothetical protein
MKVQKLRPRDVELLKGKGFVIADDGESAEFTQGELTLSIICPAVGTYADKLMLDVRLPNGTTISAVVTNLRAD